jgi:hypothetical protein
MPVARQMTDPLEGLHVSVLPAEVSAVPAARLKDVIPDTG